MDLTPLSSIQVRARTKDLRVIRAVSDLARIHRENSSIPIHILGHGTNTVWGNQEINKSILKIEISGLEILKNSREFTWIQVGAGESWDKVVQFAVENNLSGIEALSGIPGTAGAGPIQNIGAYGQEIEGSIETVTAFDWITGDNISLGRDDCEFSYRDSVFKRRKNLIITRITLKLSKKFPKTPDYPDTKKYFEGRTNPTLREIREAILEIRAKKLPDYKQIPNCGSFFKNPILSPREFKNLQAKYKDIPQFPAPDGVKIPAGWLIDQAGLKGAWIGKIQICPHNALILTNPLKNATPDDILEARDKIVQKIIREFGIKLETEPEIVT